jgi:RNA polymerase sigma-70 factor (ECF subfamily)
VAELDEAIARACETWPGLSEPALRQRLNALGTDTGLEIADVAFALACARGDTAALTHFDKTYLPALRPALARVGLDDAGIDEALQRVRQELLAPREGGAPRVANYGGRGPFAAWLRSVAVRLGLKLREDGARNVELDSGVQLQAGSIADDAELAYMKKTYGQVFERAFRAALGALPAQDRLLLKQRFKHHLGVEDLGRVHGVHAGTISRRVAAARDALAKDTREAMMRELGVPKDDMSSILRMIESQIDVTLTTLESTEP